MVRRLKDLPRAPVLRVGEFAGLHGFAALAQTASVFADAELVDILVRWEMRALGGRLDEDDEEEEEEEIPQVAAGVWHGHGYSLLDNVEADVAVIMSAHAIGILKGWLTYDDAWTPPQWAGSAEATEKALRRAVRSFDMHGSFSSILQGRDDTLHQETAACEVLETIPDSVLCEAALYLVHPGFCQCVLFHNDLTRWVTCVLRVEGRRRRLGDVPLLARRARLRRVLKRRSPNRRASPRMPPARRTLEDATARLRGMNRADVRPLRVMNPTPRYAAVIQLARSALLQRLPRLVRWLPPAGQLKLAASFYLRCPHAVRNQWGPMGPRQMTALEQMTKFEIERLDPRTLHAVRELVASDEWPTPADLAGAPVLLEAVYDWVMAVCSSL